MQMDCTQFEEVLPELAHWGPEESERLASALTHAESCGRCGLLLVETESLDFALRMLRASEVGREAQPRVETALLREFKGMKEKPSSRSRQWQFAVLGAAAVLFLALGLTLRHERSSTGSPVQGTNNVAVIAPSVPSSTWDNSRADAQVSAQPNKLNSQVAVQPDNSQKQSAANTSESAAPFTRVPYADDAATLDGAAIVRVMLPRSALASFGLTVADAGTAERIPADLVVSADGTPEAIRLVAQNN